MKKLTANEYFIINYLNGKDRYVSMAELADVTQTTKRQVRKSIQRIKLYSAETIIIANHKGYKIAKTDEEIKNANNVQKSRIKSSIEALIANDPNGASNFLYKVINEATSKHLHQAEGQIDIDGNTTSYK